jgi:hypothetical protein
LIVKQICEQFSISRGAFYNYLRPRGVESGAPRPKKNQP